MFVLVAAGMGFAIAGTTLHGCHIRPLTRREKAFRAFSLLVLPENPRKTGSSTGNRD